MITTIMQSFNRYLPQISIGVAIVVLAVIVLMPSPAPAQPMISWMPESVNETVLAGETKTISVSFTASENLGAVDVRVVPELQPFVQTNPTSFENIVAGQAVNLEIVISVAADLSPQVVDGTIQIRNAGRPPRNYARPLPVTVTITARSDGLPPDPGEAGKQTLEGIDSDNDGVRDDIQRYIALTYPDSEQTRAALIQRAKSLQEAILNANSKQASISNAQTANRAIECLYARRPNDAQEIDEALSAEFLNTEARTEAYLNFNDQVSGQIFTIRPLNQLASSCTENN